MPLKIPEIGLSDYQAILNEAVARIPIHNPEWSNHNDADPGVTLLQLFSFMVENLLYRANQIPERNRVKFLKLLSIPLQPAAAARSIVVFTNEKGPLENVPLEADLELLAAKVPFRSQDAVDVLPVETRFFYKRKIEDVSDDIKMLYDITYGGNGASSKSIFYETAQMELPSDSNHMPVFDMGSNSVVDRSLWLSIMARPNESVNKARDCIANKILSLGIYPAEDEQSGRVLRPGSGSTTKQQTDLIFEISTGKTVGNGAPSPVYHRLEVLEQVNPLVEPGIVKLRLPKVADLKTWDFDEEQDRGTGDFPPPLPEAKDNERVIAWIRIRMAENGGSGGLNARLSWMGVNAASVVQRAHVPLENLGQGSGEPDQTVTLTNTPVIPDSVRLTVGGEIWTEVDDLFNAGPEVPVRSPRQKPGFKHANAEQNHTDRFVAQKISKVFVVDRESGQIRFGDGERGTRPPLGAQILARYDYGGGREGNVNIGLINKSSALPPGLNVTNPVPAWGGDEAETQQEGEKNIPRYLQHRDRLVTQKDFKDIAKRTPGVDIGRVEVRTLFNPEYPPDRKSPGCVTLLVVPRYDTAHPDAPQPDTRMLDLICRHLEPRRLVSTEVHVVGPEYKPLVVSVGVVVVAGLDFPPVREAVNKHLKKFLSPLLGGREGTGWPLDKSVLKQELLAEAARVSGVEYVTDLLLGDADGSPEDPITIQGLELPQLLKIDTRSGDPEPLESLISGGTGGGGGTTTGDDRTGIIPMPVVPPEC